MHGTPMSTAGAPEGRGQGVSAWTGKDWIVWGGQVTLGKKMQQFNNGAHYDPATDRWTPLAAGGAPSARSVAAAAWTGTQFIVWGGYGSGVWLEDGGRYDAAHDTWIAIGATSEPPAPRKSAAVWTGTEMVVWAAPEA